MIMICCATTTVINWISGMLFYYGLGIESERTSEGVPSLELIENALFGALRWRRTEGSKLGCLRACLL